MSNLTLESTNLDRLARTPKYCNGKLGKLGYNTYAFVGKNPDIGNEVFTNIFYHHNKIASITHSEDLHVTGYRDGQITKIARFTDCGWGTPTTRNRLNMIARDNKIPISFTQRNHTQIAILNNSAYTGDETPEERNVWTQQNVGWSSRNVLVLGFDSDVEEWVELASWQ